MNEKAMKYSIFAMVIAVLLAHPAIAQQPTGTIYTSLFCYENANGELASDCFAPTNGLKLYSTLEECERTANLIGRTSTSVGKWSGWLTVRCFKRNVPLWQPAR